MEEEKGEAELWRTDADSILANLRWWVRTASDAREWKTYTNGEPYQAAWVLRGHPLARDLEEREHTTSNNIHLTLRGNAYPHLLKPLGSGSYWVQPGIDSAIAAIDRIQARLEARADPNAVDTDSWRVGVVPGDGVAQNDVVVVEWLNRNGDANQEVLCTRDQARELASILARL